MFPLPSPPHPPNLRQIELGEEGSAHEREPVDLEVGISIRNLTKVYRVS